MSIPTLPHHRTSIPPPHHSHAHPLTSPPYQKSCPVPGSWYPISVGCRTWVLPPAAAWVLHPPPRPPGSLPCAQVGQDSHFGGKAVRASAGARHSTSPTSPSIWEGKGSSRGRGRAALSQGGRPAVPWEKGSCRSWDAARRTSEGRTLGPGAAAGSGRMGSGAAAGESCIGLAADVTPQPFPPQPHWVPPPPPGRGLQYPPGAAHSQGSLVPKPSRGHSASSPPGSSHAVPTSPLWCALLQWAQHGLGAGGWLGIY